MNKIRKNKRIDLRLTEKEFLDLKEKSKNYPTLSAFIIDACMKFDDALGIKRLNLIKEWCDSYNKYDTELNRIGSNINQIAHYINKLSYTGVASVEFIPELNKQYDELIKLLSLINSNNEIAKNITHKFLTN